MTDIKGWINELKPGDEVILDSGWKQEIRKVDEVTKYGLIKIGPHFFKRDGYVTNHNLLHIAPLTKPMKKTDERGNKTRR